MRLLSSADYYSQHRGINVSTVVNNLRARTKYSHDTYRLTKLLRLFTIAADKYLKICVVVRA